MDHSLRPFGDHRKAGDDGKLPPIMPEKGHEPGIYLHLPKEEHDADPAIGSSAHRKLRSGPTEFYYQWRGADISVEDEEENTTPARLFGSAVHAVVLEGEAALKRRFACEPDGDWPKLVRTMDDMRRLLKPAGFAVSGVKEELATRVRGNFPGTVLYDDVMDDHKRYGRQVLKADAWKRVLLASRHITMHPQLSRSFKGGMSEISIYWINALGIRCKARLDYLRMLEMEIRGKKAYMGSVSDLKSFSNPRTLPLVRAVDMADGDNILQAVHYMDALTAAVKMLREHGLESCLDQKPNEREWLKIVAKMKRQRFSFVFYKSSGAPYADATWHEPNDPLIGLARQSVMTNFLTFREYYETFGTDIWVNLSEPRHLASEDDIRPWQL